MCDGVVSFVPMTLPFVNHSLSAVTLPMLWEMDIDPYTRCMYKYICVQTYFAGAILNRSVKKAVQMKNGPMAEVFAKLIKAVDKMHFW